MLLGFISLLLTVLQGAISKMCIPEKFVRHMLPCSLKDKQESTGLSTTEHIGGFRRLLSEAAGSQAAYCAKKVMFNSSMEVHCSNMHYQVYIVCYTAHNICRFLWLTRYSMFIKLFVLLSDWKLCILLIRFYNVGGTLFIVLLLEFMQFFNCQENKKHVLF